MVICWPQAEESSPAGLIGTLSSPGSAGHACDEEPWCRHQAPDTRTSPMARFTDGTQRKLFAWTHALRAWTVLSSAS